MFDRPCNVLWNVLTDTKTWVQWGPSVKEVQSENRFISQGTEGRIKTAAGIWLPFVIDQYLEGAFWSWKVAGIPATGHRVQADEDGLCLVIFEIPIAAAPYAYICKIALDRIGRIVHMKNEYY